MAGELLYRAATAGNEEEVTRLLDVGTPADMWKDPVQNRTALHAATEAGHHGVVLQLLKKGGANCNAETSGGQTALHLAAPLGHTQVVKALLGAGAVSSASSPLSGNKTPLHMAAYGGHVDIMWLLVAAGATINVKDSEGNTPLHVSAAYGHLRVAKALIEELGAGHVLKWGGSNCETPFDKAERSKNKEMASYLKRAEKTYEARTKAACGSPRSNTVLRRIGVPRFGTARPATVMGMPTTGPEPTITHQSVVVMGNTTWYPPKKDDLDLDTDVSMATEYHREKDKTLVPAAADVVDTGGVFNTELGDYKLNFSDPLGKGTWGEVYSAIHKDGGNVVALKRVTWDAHNSAKLPVDPLKEIQSYRRVPKHENIVNLLSHNVAPGSLMIVMELCECGDVEKYFVKCCPALEERVDFMEQASCGLLHLHSQSPMIVHRDIKPQNLLLHNNGTRLVLKIGDFGFATLMECSVMGTFCGTMEYIAPEVLPQVDTNIVSYSRECDIFSLGLVFHAMTRFKEGDKGLKPSVEGKPDRTMSFAQLMQNAEVKGTAMPRLTRIGEKSDFTLGKMNHLVNWMTRYQPHMRLTLTEVNRELHNIIDGMKTRGIGP